jgi:hypothetical protein
LDVCGSSGVRRSTNYENARTFRQTKAVQQLKEDLQLSDGNLATHSMEQEKYITFFKETQGHKTRTVYTLTPEGEATLNALSKTLAELNIA